MNARTRCDQRVSSWLALIVVAGTGGGAEAVPSFISADPRLPNPDRPYVMEGRSPEFGGLVFIDDLVLRSTNPSQLDTLSQNADGDWEFDSTFDIEYTAILSVGLAPSVPITGLGTVRAVGIADGDTPVLSPRVYETELVMLDLQGSSSYVQFRLRESPTLESLGVTTTEDPCPVCGAPFFGLRISSFFDVFAEISLDSGATWMPGASSFRISQTPEPGTGLLAVVGGGVWMGRRRIGRRRTTSCRYPVMQACTYG